MARRRHYDDGADEAPKPKLDRESLRESLKIFEFIRPFKWQFILGMFLLFLTSLVFMVFPALIGEMLDEAQGNGTLGFTLVDLGYALIGILLVQGFITFNRVMIFARISEKGTANVRRALYESLVGLPVQFYEKNRLGDLVSRLTADVDRLYSVFSITLAEFARQIIILVVGIVFLAVTNWKLSAIMLITFPVVIILAMFFGKYIRKLSKERQKELAETNNILGETVQNIQTVKSFTNELFELRRYNFRIDKVIVVALKYARGRALFATFIVTFLFGALFFVIWQGMRMVSTGELTAGGLLTFTTYTAIIGGAIASVGNFYAEIIGAVGATERIREILRETPEISLTEESDAVRPYALDGSIRYQDVHFSYPTRADVPVLKGLSFEVPAGRKVALVGSSGAGKSTIVQLLLKYYQLESGKITVGGEDIRTLDTRRYRKSLAIVPQEVLLFAGTIKENILYGKPDATDAELERAARQANAWEFIQQFPEGMQTLVGERGVKLSGGQRQRIAIARAILKNPKILLLDEATSSLDAESERLVQDALNRLMEGRTSIIIAHRLSTIREVDRIYVIDNGRIVESGTHTELSIREDGVYNNLLKLQMSEV